MYCRIQIAHIEEEQHTVLEKNNIRGKTSKLLLEVIHSDVKFSSFAPKIALIRCSCGHILARPTCEGTGMAEQTFSSLHSTTERITLASIRSLVDGD